MSGEGKWADTFDWTRYWIMEKESAEMQEAARKMAKRMRMFMSRIDARAFADFGCGPATMLFQLARKFPGIEFIGFDSSSSVVSQNRSKAQNLGLTNLEFTLTSLPRIRTQRTFDIITCLATLHYISEIELAVRNLFSRVNHRGYLIFNYPNRTTKRWYEDNISPDDLESRNRFSLVLNGVNLLTLKGIGKVLGKRPHSFWKAVSEAAKPGNVCVFVRKD